MSGIWTLAMKDLRLLSRDPMSLFFIIVFPVAMGIFFGYIGASFGEQTEGRMKLAVVDEDDSEMSRLFTTALDRNEAVSAEMHPRGAAVDLVRRGKLAGYVVLAPGFGESAGIIWADAPTIEVGVDPSHRAEGLLLQGFIMQAMSELVQARFRDPATMRSRIARTRDEIAGADDIPPARKLLFQGLFTAVDQFLVQLSESQEQLQAGDADTLAAPRLELARIDVVTVTGPAGASEQLTRKLRSQWDVSFPAAIMWGVMGCVAGFAVSIAKERTEGTFLRLSLAPLARAHILAGKGLACFLTALAVIASMMALGKVLGIQITSLPLLVLATFCVALSFVGLMMLLSVIGKTEQAVGGAGWAIIVVMAMFGGGMVPLIFLPGFMQTASHVSPVKWGVLALEGAVWRGFSLTEELVPCGVLLGMGAVSFAIGATVLKEKGVRLT